MSLLGYIVRVQQLAVCSLQLAQLDEERQII